jgi:ferredoxin
MKRVDEQDIIFSRMNYKEGSREYEDYYKRNPHNKDIDQDLRSMPELGGPGTATYDPISSPIVTAAFRFLSDIKKYSEGPSIQHAGKPQIEAQTMTERIRGIAGFYRADLVGITEMKEHHYYSHRGRDTDTYGSRIESYHRYGIVFAVEMDKDMIFRAPQLPEAITVTKGYVDAAVIGMVLAYYIRELGYEARNHMDGNYLVVAPLLARDAGLGEMGRNGLLITPQYGPRVRLGVVTTDLPLVADSPADYGIAQFCMECEKCVKTCPGKAIPAGPQQEVDGIKRWKINGEECYRKWRALGTDCGICLAACPFSDNIPQELLAKIKGCSNTRKEIMKLHEQKHGIRPYIKDKPQWL